MTEEKLIYVDDSLPGITRKRAGTGWAYYNPKGALIKNKAERTRLNAVALPPAYKEAWFCPAANGHILATGVDDAGRKQYRYNPNFRLMKESEKFDGCAVFGNLLPLVRKRVAEDIEADDLSREKVIAAVVRLLDLGFVRIGNDTYAKKNKSFGATTLRRRHVDVEGETVHLHFRGKSGQERDVEIADEALSEAVMELQDLKGQHLFQFVDPDGTRHQLGSSDVNEYLRETMGENFTAKNFRTWHASVLAYDLLAKARDNLTMKAVLEFVSDQLGNTPAVVRSSYIHPAVLDVIESQEDWRSKLRMPRSTTHQSREERGLLALLEAAPSTEELLAK